MNPNPDVLLSFIIFAPAICALIMAPMDGRAVDQLRGFTLFATIITFAATILLWFQL